MQTLKLKLIISLGLMLCALTINQAIAQEAPSGLDRSPSVDVSGNAPSSEKESASSDVDLPAPEPSRPGGQSSYVYDLKKLINQSRDNIKRVNEKIKEQAVIKRNQKREEKAREYYEAAEKLTEEGKFDQAREYYEKAIRITDHPEMTGYIKQSQKRLKAQEAALKKQDKERTHQLVADEKSKIQDISESYNEAVSLYRQKKFRPAKEAFDHIEETMPDYKATQSYLKILDQDIMQEDQVLLKQQKIQMENQQKEVEVARVREKEAWHKEIEKKEQERKSQISKQAEDVYLQAVDLYKKKKYKEAKTKFQEVAWVFPDYKATNNYLKRVDGDIEEFDKMQAQEQEKILAKQRWEEEVARSKQELERKKQLEAEQKAKQKQLEEQANFTYAAAVKLFDQGAYPEALDMFKDIQKITPNYKSTGIYLARIEKINVEKARKEKEAKEKAEQEKLAQLSREERLKKEAEEQQRIAQEKQKQQELEVQLNQQYELALSQWRNRDFEASKETFQKINAQQQNFKKTQKYLDEVDVQIGRRKAELALAAKNNPKINQVIPTSKPAAIIPERKPPVVVVAPKAAPVVDNGYAVPSLPKPVVKKVVTPVAVAQPVVTVQTIEAQMSESAQIMDLVEKSQALLNQMSSLNEDRHTVAMKRKLSQFNGLINQAKDQKDKIIRDARAKMMEAEQAKYKAQQEEREQQAQQVYALAVDLLRQKEFEKAKIKLLELENIYPNFKKTREYLANIENDRQRAEQLAKQDIDKQHEQQLINAQEKEHLELKEQQALAARRQAELRKAQQEQLQSLSSRALAINDEVIELTKQKRYADIKTKIAELQGVVTSFKALKDIVTQQEEQDKIKRQQERDMNRLRQEALRAQREERGQVIGFNLSSQEKRLQPGKRIDESVYMYRKRDEIRQRDMLYNQGVELYERKKYSQSRLIFEELKNRRDPRAPGWISKLDHVVSNEIVHYKKLEARQQTDYLAERVRVARKADIIEQKERERQRHLAVEYERQRQLAESQRQEERRRMEATRMQDNERLRKEQENKKLLEKERKEQEVFRFRKVDATKKKEEPKTEIFGTLKKKSVSPKQEKPVENSSKVLKNDELDKQREEQIELSKKRKAYFDELYQKQIEEKKKAAEKQKQKEKQLIQATEAKSGEKAFNKIINTKEERLEKINKERVAIEQKRQQALAQEREREEVLLKQKEEARKRKEEEAKQKDEERKRKDEARRMLELARQQQLAMKREQEMKLAQAKAQKLKEENAAKLEAQRKLEFEKALKLKQMKFEADRQAIRKKMEMEVDDLYNQAMQLYRTNQFERAAAKFQDVEDVLPGYKQTRQMIVRSRDALLGAKKPQVTLDPVVVNRTPTAANLSKQSATLPAHRVAPSRADAIKNTLDLFDPDVK